MYAQAVVAKHPGETVAPRAVYMDGVALTARRRFGGSVGQPGDRKTPPAPVPAEALPMQMRAQR
eukprot:2588833-Lingulodinium_polyedra.AAC.1